MVESVQVPKRYLDEYLNRVQSVSVPEKVELVPIQKRYSDEYLKMVESVSIPETCRIRAGTRKW